MCCNCVRNRDATGWLRRTRRRSRPCGDHPRKGQMSCCRRSVPWHAARLTCCGAQCECCKMLRACAFACSAHTCMRLRLCACANVCVYVWGRRLSSMPWLTSRCPCLRNLSSCGARLSCACVSPVMLSCLLCVCVCAFCVCVSVCVCVCVCVCV
jgi:hypothetical protein